LLGTVSDLWELKYAGRVGLSYIIAPFLGPSLDPLIGAYVIAEYDNNLKYAIWVIMMILAPGAPAIVSLKETSKRRILYLQAKRRGSDLNVRNKSVVMKRIGNVMLKPLHMCLVEVYSCHFAL
jgi:MFS family permease